MEKRKLNLHAPLMSVRRYASPLKSSENLKGNVVQKNLDMKQQSCKSNGSGRRSEMVIKPDGIPFHWEHSPGRPKDDFGSQEQRNSRLSLARSLDAFRRHRSGELPRPTSASRIGRFTSGEGVPDYNIYKPQIEAFSFSEHAMLVEKLNESLNCPEENGSQSGDAYSDALDELSSLESGLLGDNADHGFSVMPSEPCSVDTQTRSIMMKRFLREAKAAVVEAQDPVKKSVSRAIAPLPNASASLPHLNPYADDGESEDEIPSKKSGRSAWGFLPRFCVKNSFCLMNPLPALRSKKRSTSVPKAVESRKITRKATSGPLERSASPVPVLQKKKYHSGLLSRDMPVIDSRLNSNSSDSYKSGLAQLRRYRSGSESPYRTESAKSPFREGVGSIAHEVEGLNGNKLASSRKLFNALHDVSRSHVNARGSVPTRETVEKTVYIDVSSYKKDGHPDISSGNLKADQGRGEIEDVKPGYKQMPLFTKDRKVTQEIAKKPFPLAPPLPDSPSESWLRMTTARKTFPPRLPPKKQSSQCQRLVSKEHKQHSQDVAPCYR